MTIRYTIGSGETSKGLQLYVLNDELASISRVTVPEI